MSKQNFVPRKQELQLKSENTSLFLKVIISIAIFIFAITLSGVLAVDSMITNWNKSILGSLTVQIIPSSTLDKEKSVAETSAMEEKAVDFLKSVNGIIKVTPLSDEQMTELLSPWLGDDVDIRDLPVPRIIDVERVNSITSLPTTQKYRDVILSAYEQTDEGMKLRSDITNENVKLLKMALENLGYFSASTALKQTANGAMSKITSFFDNAKQ